jgi:hypothetical protein
MYALIHHVKQVEGKHRIVITTSGTCNALFYDGLHQGNIHNGKIKSSNGGSSVGFYMGNIHIEEHGHDQDTQTTIDTLNESIAKRRPDKTKYKHIPHDDDEPKQINKYVYTGQHHHGLAYEYYTNNVDKHIVSICSP